MLLLLPSKNIMNNLVSKIKNDKKLHLLIIVLLSALAAVSYVQGIRNAAEFSQDFQWDAAKVFTMRINPYRESMNPSGCLDSFGYDEYYLQMEANQFPSLLMLLIPYTFLPPLVARYAWIVSNMLFTVGIVFLLRKTFLKSIDRDLFIILSLLMIAGTPYRNQIGVGQHTLFAFFFFLLAVFLSEKRGLLPEVFTVLSLFVCYFKYTLTVPLCLYFVYKKKYKEIIISAGIHVALTFVAAWWLNSDFLSMIIEPLKVSSALAAEGGLDFGVLLGGSKLSYVLALVVMLILLFIAIKLPPGYDEAYISVLVLWSLIITYHRTYDFWVIIVVAAFFVAIYRNYLVYFYSVVLMGVFFVLRVFSESVPSKLAVGTIYYAFTIVLTAVLVKDMIRTKEEVKEEHTV